MFSGELNDARVAQWQYDLLFSIGSASWLIHFSVVVLTAVVLALDEPSSWVAAWFTVMSIGTFSLALLSITYRRKQPDPEKAMYFGIAHGVLTGIVGIIWGIGALFAADDGKDLLFYTLVMGGAALGAVSSQHARLQNCIGSIWTSIPLLAIAQILPGTELRNIAASGMVLLFGVSLTVMATRLHRFLSENVRINELLNQQNTHLTEVSGELQEAQNVRLRFLAQASHDLRQPIHAVGLFVECLKSVRVKQEREELLARIDKSMNTLARLCRSLLDVAALDVGKVVPRNVDVALAEVIGDVVRQAEEVARENGVVIRSVNTELWTRTDPALLHNMLQNLLSNAIKYAPNGKVLIGIRRSGDKQIALEIIDQGEGIALEDQKRIFGEFVRLENRATSNREGLGLGLPIVRRLANFLGLSLKLHSRPSVGTRFQIAGLKIVAENKTFVPQPAYKSQLNGMNVLVVDDDDDVRESTSQMLKRWGCQVESSASFPETEIVESADFIICDQDLGTEYGLDLIRRFRQRSMTSIPAVVATGSEISGLQTQAAIEQITVLSKPIRPAQLRSMLVAARAKATASYQTKPRSAANPAAAARELTPSDLNRAET